MPRRLWVVCFIGVLFATAASGQLATPKFTGLVITNGDMTVDYTPVTGAVSYEVEVVDRLSGLRLALATSTAARLTIGGKSLPSNKQVDLKVKAVDVQKKTSPQSAPLSTVTAPAPPAGITGTPGKNQIAIQWKPVPGAASYRLTLSNGLSVVAKGSPYTFTGLPTATSFNLIMWSYNAAGAQSPASAPVVVKTANIMLLE